MMGWGGVYTVSMSVPSQESQSVHLADAELPLVTSGLPGIGGVLKSEPADFIVEEIPAYPPEESGEFLFAWVEKTGLSAEQLTSHLARHLGIAHQDVGQAGMKDRQAVTRQLISVPARCAGALAAFEHDQIRVLETHRHRHKLRTGHLKGNRFIILVRDVTPHAAERGQAIGDELTRRGVPNYFGEQRFGRDNETLQLGFDLLRGVKQPGDIPRARRKFLLRLALSAAQSALFNQALADRIRAGALLTVQVGDVMQVVASHGLFVAEDLACEQPRFDAHEIVPTGPIFGPKMVAARSEPGAREARLLDEFQLTADVFAQYGKLTLGTRRAYVTYPGDLQVAAEGHDLRLQFTLPAGCYATVLLAEFMKAGGAKA